MSDGDAQSRQGQPGQQEQTEELGQVQLQGQQNQSERKELVEDPGRGLHQGWPKKAKPQDAFDSVLYGMAEQTRRQFEADMVGLKAKSDADRIKARLRCEED